MWRYESWGNGAGVRIDAPDGRSVWMQGDDAAQVLADLDRCATVEAEQAVLSQYEPVVSA